MGQGYAYIKSTVTKVSIEIAVDLFSQKEENTPTYHQLM